MSPAVAIVGAGPGLGAAIADRFARGGWDLGLIALRHPILDDLEADLRRYDVRRSGTVADATVGSVLGQAFDHLADDLGPPQVMIYNASLYQPQPALELTAEDLRLSFDVHVLGAFNAAQHAARLMRPARRGFLVFTINCLALHPEAVSAAMSVGKGAQHNLALSLEAELADAGIRVAVVTITAPIRSDTPFDPRRIAELYWAVANQPADRFERDHVFAGAG